MESKLAAAISAYATVQSKVLDRVFDNIERTGSPSSADLAFCLPNDVIAGMPESERYDVFLRKLHFLGYAMWKSSCYRQVREHAAFEAERVRLLERFPELNRQFEAELQQGRSAATPTVEADTPAGAIGASVAQNGCTLFVLNVPDDPDASRSSDESRRKLP